MNKSEVPQVIVVRDLDGGYILAKIEFIDQIGDGPAVPVYRYVEYYHSLESVLKAIK